MVCIRMQVAVDISPGAYIIIIMPFTGEIIFETDKSENKKLCTGVKPSPSALRPCLTLCVHTYLIFICVIIISVYYNCCTTTLVGVQYSDGGITPAIIIYMATVRPSIPSTATGTEVVIIRH